MKKIITIIILALACISLSAKDVVKNPVTNKVLDKTAGVYSIKGPKGIIILGTEEMTKEFLLSASEAFSKEILHRTFKIGDDQYEVLKDDAGLYIRKIGLGVVKVRQSDVVVFSPGSEESVQGCQGRLEIPEGEDQGFEGHLEK